MNIRGIGDKSFEEATSKKKKKKKNLDAAKSPKRDLLQRGLLRLVGEFLEE
jgi:hypothetical protein